MTMMNFVHIEVNNLTVCGSTIPPRPRAAVAVGRAGLIFEVRPGAKRSLNNDARELAP